MVPDVMGAVFHILYFWWWSPNFKYKLEAGGGKRRHQAKKGPRNGKG